MIPEPIRFHGIHDPEEEDDNSPDLVIESLRNELNIKNQTLKILDQICEKYQIIIWRDEDGYNCEVEDDNQNTLAVIYSENWGQPLPCKESYTLLEVLKLAKEKLNDNDSG